MPDTNPVLHFDFRPGEAVLPGAGSPSPSVTPSPSVGPLSFHRPIEVISARRLEDVAPALARVEAAALEGRWAAGFVSYESAPAFDPAFRVKESGPLPLLWLGIFEGPVSPEKTDPGASLLGSPGPALVPANNAPFDLGHWRPDVDAPEYHRCIGVIRDGIRDGAVYQVNYTLRLRAPFSGDPLALHRRLCAAQGSSYSAYLDLGPFAVLSASPELFFERNGSTITSHSRSACRHSTTQRPWTTWECYPFASTSISRRSVSWNSRSTIRICTCTDSSTSHPHQSGQSSMPAS